MVGCISVYNLSGPSFIYMIFNALVELVANAFILLIGLLPSASSQDVLNVINMKNSLDTIQSYVSAANFWFPVDDLFTILVLMVGVEISIGLFLLARYIAHILTVGVIK